MCGIFAVFGSSIPRTECETRKLASRVSKRLRHRGPDWSGIKVLGVGSAIGHERLTIMGVDSGAQPIVSGTDVLSVNGEIYNYRDLLPELSHHNFITHSDCEVILHLYKDIGVEVLDRINGIFAFVLYVDGEYMIARDPIGVNSLYQGWGSDGSRWFASEMKCLIDHCERIEVFPPGAYYSSINKTLVQYYAPIWYSPDYVPTRSGDPKLIREQLERSVRRQMMSQVPFGALLSGGLDSSLIASIASRAMKEKGQRLETFSIGLKGAQDLRYAAQVAEFLGTRHYEFHFTVEEGIDAIEEAIYFLETYDVTTIRASIPMFILARHIKSMGVKMVLSGEGADEIFGGYLYFHHAPNSKAFHRECVSRIRNLHLADCLRANKATMGWGVETRVPFLDKEFLQVAMDIDPHEKVANQYRMEKHVLRQAFDAEDEYLPKAILWRQKEQFSDGVGYGWIDGLKSFCSDRVSDERMEMASQIFHFDAPLTKEEFYYRYVFQSLFGGTAAASTVKKWVPRTDWGCNSDPSGRAQKVHHDYHTTQ